MGWYILSLPLLLAYAFQCLLGLAFIIVGLWNSWKAHTWSVRLAWLLVAVFPFLFFAGNNFRIWLEQNARTDSIQNSEHLSIKDKHFSRVVTFDQFYDRMLIEIFAVVRPKEIITIYDGKRRLDKGGKATRLTFKDTSNCNASLGNKLRNTKYEVEWDAQGIEDHEGGPIRQAFYRKYRDLYSFVDLPDDFDADECLVSQNLGEAKTASLPKDALYIFTAHSTSFNESSTTDNHRFELRAYDDQELKLVTYEEQVQARYQGNPICFPILIECGEILSYGKEPALSKVLFKALNDVPQREFDFQN
jgi:hypothetical protein